MEMMFKLVEADESESMASAMRSAMRTLSPMTRVVTIADGPDGHDERLWAALSSQLGVTGVLIPQEHGGLGMDWRVARIVLGELGRGLACVPFLESAVVAPTVILDAGDPEAEHDLLPRIADGSLVATVSFGGETALGDDAAAAVHARDDSGTWRLTGSQPFVSHAEYAGLFLVIAATGAGDHGWFAIEGEDPTLSRTPMTVVDTTRPLSTVDLADTPARLIGQLRPFRQLAEGVLSAAVVGSACEQEAASRFLLETTVEYTRSRYQFGRPIGSFQALQHRLADLAVAVDTSTSAVEYAVWAAADAPHHLAEAASVAGFTCSETFFRAACEAIQMHGGIGFTWEHMAHRYYRRALTSRALFGKPSFHRERLLESLSI
jgi:alkylation response protein AidB-like acyl-CoA dehydrogenase